MNQPSPQPSPRVPSPRVPTPRLLARGALREARVVSRALRTETVGGALLLAAAIIALGWANSPWHESYVALREHRLTVPGVGLSLSLGKWAADGLLAIFFFVAGLELKREFVAGDLADRSKAAVPIVAAVCGAALPAMLYAAAVLTLDGGGDALAGWAIPTATDIAFALAVLAVLGTHLPSALRAFLLTLAVVDDLIAITIIAVFYSGQLHAQSLGLALLPIAAFAVLVRRGSHPLLRALLVALALLTWYLVHESGVHATVAGIVLGLLVPAHVTDPEHESVAERIEHAVRPVSAGLAVPLFAFCAAGVRVVDSGIEQLGQLLTDPVLVGIVLGLVVGKAIGVSGGTWLVARFTRAELDEGLAWSDIVGVAILSGLGFTVSLLIGELAYGAGTARDDTVKVGVLLGSLLAAGLAALVLRRRNAHYRALEVAEGNGPPPGRVER